MPEAIEALILALKREHPSWGAPKIREKTKRKALEIPLPVISTVHAVLNRYDMVNKLRRKRHHKAQGTFLSTTRTLNDLLCADYKGEFMLPDRRYCAKSLPMCPELTI